MPENSNANCSENITSEATTMRTERQGLDEKPLETQPET
jgi:hypothetical protein